MASAIGLEPPFHETMPARYRELFRGPTVHQHATIVARRGSLPAHAEIWKRLPNGGAVACIVAEDRSGLLSCLDTALAARSIDILSAQVFERAGPKGAEVVDFFWLRRDEELGLALVDADLAGIADLLGGLMTGDLRVDGRPLRTRPASPESATPVGFEEATCGGAPALYLETVDRPGLFRAVASALIDAKVRIIRSKRAGGPGDRVIHRFAIAELNGRTPNQHRRGLLQAEVLRVVDTVARKAVSTQGSPSGYGIAG
jgi:UTP:GlnB (protein PII) uridylyltransferase